MFGLFVLEASLALILSNRLSIKLVNEIFTVQFLDKLDLEVAACYSKVGPNVSASLWTYLGISLICLCFLSSRPLIQLGFDVR